MTINYELAKQLKDAGFPYACMQEYYDLYGYVCVNGVCINVPTLSELIEACGPVLCLERRDAKEQWYAWRPNVDARGTTPEEAVANLWLALRNV